MAFKIHMTDDNRVPGIEYLPAAAITPKIGMALIQSGGNLTTASSTTAPTYISMCEKDSACAAGDIIPVIRVNKDMMFETAFSATATALKLGDKVTINTDGLTVTATKTNGVAEIVYMEGMTAGDMCLVRF